MVRFDAVFGGGRRDEEKARAKERILSHRDEFGQWDPRNQRPELWSLYNARLAPGEHIRAFPISNWTELDIWSYIELEGIELPSIYYAHERDVFERDHAFARAIVNELAERYRSVVRALKNEKLRTSAERLANWILCADAQQGHQRNVELAFEKRTLASSLGMTPENLSRNLALLAKYGVRSSGRDIIIEDSTALERFAKPNSLIDG